MSIVCIARSHATDFLDRKCALRGTVGPVVFYTPDVHTFESMQESMIGGNKWLEAEHSRSMSTNISGSNCDCGDFSQAPL